MAKRQNFIVGSTNDNTATLTPTQLNTAWNHNALLESSVLDGTFNAVSDYSNDSSNEIANAIQSITGAEPTGASQNELGNALQQMRNEIETTSLTFKGFVSSTEPSTSDYTFVEGNLWINSATMPTSFPIAASSIKRWNGTAWVNYGSSYTPADFDFFRNVNDNEGYYWFGGQWTVMSTDMDTTYFALNPSGKWTINDNMKNISNWSSNVSNCITEIPQDIKLELSSGTLTLKAGSKCYLKTDTTTPSVNVASDLTTTQSTNGTYFAIYNGSGLTTVLTTAYDYSSLPSTFSFPLALITVSGGSISSIDQVFNGFGYIGSTIFILPNVSGLVPRYRNTDGTLKSNLVTNTVVKTSTFGNAANGRYEVMANQTGVYYNNTNVYDEAKNINTAAGLSYHVGWVIVSSGVIQSFDIGSAFHAVDYSDIRFLLNALYPVGALYIGTQATCPMSTLMPGTTWSLVSSGKALWTGDGLNANTTIAAGLPNITGSFTLQDDLGITSASGAMTLSNNRDHDVASNRFGSVAHTVDFAASNSNNIYGASSTVQPPAYVVNVWRRTA